MRLFVLAFTLATVALQQQAELPAVRWALAGLALLVAIVLIRRERWIVRGLAIAAAAALVGFGLAAWRAEARLSDELPRALEGQDVAVTGIIAGLPQATANGVRFLFEVEEGVSVPRWVSLAWYEPWARESAQPPPKVAAGQRWKLTV